MKWNRKFNYPTSSRSVLNGSRHYAVNQQRLPSVTAILSLTKPEEDKAALARRMGVDNGSTGGKGGNSNARIL